MSDWSQLCGGPGRLGRRMMAVDLHTGETRSTRNHRIPSFCRGSVYAENQTRASRSTWRNGLSVKVIGIEGRWVPLDFDEVSDDSRELVRIFIELRARRV